VSEEERSFNEGLRESKLVTVFRKNLIWNGGQILGMLPGAQPGRGPWFNAGEEWRGLGMVGRVAVWGNVGGGRVNEVQRGRFRDMW